MGWNEPRWNLCTFRFALGQPVEQKNKKEEAQYVRHVRVETPVVHSSEQLGKPNDGITHRMKE